MVKLLRYKYNKHLQSNKETITFELKVILFVIHIQSFILHVFGDRVKVFNRFFSP